MDGQLFSTINGLAGHVDPIDDAFEFFATFGPYLLILIAVALWFWPAQRAERDRRQWGAILAAISGAIALGVNQVIILIWDRPRPFVDHHALLLLSPSHDPSFPSDHATFGFAVAVALLLVSRRAGLAALLVAVIMAFARVYTGEHYLSDVVAGACIGAAVALVVRYAEPMIMRILGVPLGVARRFHLA